MKPEFAPRALPIAAFAESASQYSGIEKLHTFTRLLEEAQGHGTQTPVHYTVQGEARTDAAGHAVPWLHLQAHTELRMVCQRCLAPVDVPLVFAQDFRFVATEDMAAEEDEACEENVLAISKTFDLLDLLEDELLMAIPLVPKHAVCPQPVVLEAVDPNFAQETTAKVHPFAVLQQLKKNTSES